MGIKVILFDLDGTLLPMDQDEFIKMYFGGLVRALLPHGYDAERLPKAIWLGTGAMIENDGMATNEEVFWQTFSTVYGKNVREDEPLFEKFYAEDFDKVSAVATPDPAVPELIHRLKADGYRIALATNPVFPAIATQKRTRWAGISVDDFELYTTYENSRYCKPSLDYYRGILDKLGVSAEDCLMVGNDVSDDMVTEKLGMKVFLITKHLINKDGADISGYPQGDFHDLYEYIKAN
ncbi:MAG: HAD family hydrolase [Clostridia bacterium]|nr:HAD family hydrolase [Clostridia bacterium]